MWFLRINSEHREGSVFLAKQSHPFLDYDSWLHCWGELIETDEGRLAELLLRQGVANRRGVLGQIAPSARTEALAAIENSPLLAHSKIRRIVTALQGP